MSVASKNKWITIVLYHQICTRETASALRVQNGDLIIMGGLINKEEREARTRTPIIGNVPLFGGLTTM
jgi:type II secretory pathway component GspD/PulD (secretin)